MINQTYIDDKKVKELYESQRALLSMLKLNVVKASINSCKLSYFYLLKIHDRKGLIRSVYLDKPVSEELKKNFRNAHFFIFEDKLF